MNTIKMSILAVVFISALAVATYACEINFCSDIACTTNAQCFSTCDSGYWYYGERACTSSCSFSDSKHCGFQYRVCADADSCDGYPEVGGSVRTCGAQCDQETDYSEVEGTCYYNCNDACSYAESCSVEAYCDGDLRYYDGSCSETGCSFASENCSELPTGITCTVVHFDSEEWDSTEILFENYSYYTCNSGDCAKQEAVTGYICDMMFEFNVEECGGNNYYCYYDDGFMWGDSFPESETNCSDGHDNDNDGLVDDEDDDCYECSLDEDCNDCNVCTIDQCVDGSCVFSNADDGTVCDDGNSSTVNDVCTAGICAGETDDDGDGYGDDDCDDFNPAVNPGATEVCNDGVDNDCNGQTDCDDAYCSSYPACLPPAPTGGGFIGGGGVITSTECGNEKCEYKENCMNCPEDCLKEDEVCCNNVSYVGSCCVDADCGEGYECDLTKICVSVVGGGVTEPTAGCLEDWLCTDWSECVNGNMTRTCVDANDCGTVFNKTAEFEECEDQTSPITGLFSFFTSPSGYGVLTASLILFLIIFLLSRRKR